MSDSGKIIRASIWSKIKKKNIQKQYNTKNYEYDEIKTREALEQWKKEYREKEDEEIKKLKELPDTLIMEDSKQLKEIEPVHEQSIKSEIPKIHYTAFNLQLQNLKKTGGSTVIYGASLSGKTRQAIDIMEKYYGDKNIIRFVISPSLASDIYKRIKNKKYILLEKWNDRLIKDLHKIQKRTNNKYIFVIMVDDCILEKLSPQMLQLFLVLRNNKINTILNLQTITLLSKNARNNVNNVIFRHFNNNEARKQAIEYFLGGFSPFYGLSMEDKIKLYTDATADYGYIYLDSLHGNISFHRKK